MAYVLVVGPLVAGGHVTAGNLGNAPSFGHVSLVVGYFPLFNLFRCQSSQLFKHF